jgi:23S rRNA (cytosine1962-C5)-methyltransferase
VEARQNVKRLVDSELYTVDLFGDVAVLSTYGEVDALAIARSLKARAVYLKRRPKEARRVSQSDAAPEAPIVGEPVEQLVAEENGMKFEIRPGNGLSVGLYLDARDARSWVREHARGRTVLNAFSYTCGFAVAALHGGAARVLNIDRSRKVLDWGERNLQLNGFEPQRRDFIAGDVFEWLPRLAKKGERFDLVILDPPSFATAERSRFSAARDYPKLVQLAAPLVKETLVACCNLSSVDAKTVERWVAPLRAMETFGAPPDFAQPSALKVVIARL